MRLVPDFVLTPRGWERERAVVVADGRIAAVEPAEAPRAGDVRLAGRALVPGTVNAHCHAFQSLLRGLGDDLDFMTWRDRFLYSLSARLDREGIALGARFAFAEMLLHGATTCVDFFYLQDSGNENAEAVIAAHRGDATATVQPAPHSPHGATPLRHLDRLGVLGPRLVGVHCVWLDDGEIGLLGERGVALAYCPSSNMFLGDGITRIPEMLRAGVRVGLGTDGGCTNNRLSVFDEMRMTSLLQRARLLDGAALGAEAVFAMGTREGARILRLPAGEIASGRLADLVALDLEHPSLHPRLDLLKTVVYAMSHQAIRDVWVHGRRVVDGGRLVTVDAADLLARVRALTSSWAG